MIQTPRDPKMSEDIQNIKPPFNKYVKEYAKSPNRGSKDAKQYHMFRREPYSQVRCKQGQDL